MNTSRSALITGASSGIGLDLARVFAADGYRVVLVARSEDKLRAVANELGGTYIVADLAKPEAPRQIFDQLRGTEIDALVNNAGFGVLGPFAENDLDAELEMIQVNVVALTHLTKLFLKPMLARRSGHILNVASTAAFQPGPLMAIYYATKAYVLSFSEAIADELRDSGVTVTAFCPGPTETAFADRADMRSSRLFKFVRPMSSADVARAGFEAMKKGKRVAIPGLRNRIVAESVRFSPRRLVTTLTRSLNTRT